MYFTELEKRKSNEKSLKPKERPSLVKRNGRLKAQNEHRTRRSGGFVSATSVHGPEPWMPVKPVCIAVAWLAWLATRDYGIAAD